MYTYITSELCKQGKRDEETCFPVAVFSSKMKYVSIWKLHAIIGIMVLHLHVAFRTIVFLLTCDTEME